MSLNHVLIVEDDADLREALGETVELAGYHCLLSENGEGAMRIIADKKPHIVISDVQMEGMNGHALLKNIKKTHPDIPFILITAHGCIHDAVKAIHSGAADYLAKPFEPQALVDRIKQYIPQPTRDEHSPIAEAPQSKQLLALAARVAKTKATLMISGESGTGKEVLARYIHDNSDRAKKPFVAINCAAIPENMLEATLFGYEKGSFTGAYKAMPGKFEQAQGGSLLLDEISEMNLSLQAKLLRVLQEKEVERIGSQKIIKLDVRIIATTNRDMQQEIQLGRFREDLYFRLNVFPLYWIPLRQRPQDVIPLAEYLINSHAQEQSIPIPTLSDESKKAMHDYSWPGNAREMDNVIQRSLILSNGDVIEVEDLQLDIKTATNLNDSLKQHEYQLICQAIDKCRGDRKKTAELLGISDRVLQQKITKMRDLGMIAADVFND